MHEFGSHHSFAERTRPSLFEILAEENLASGLRSAFRHLFQVFAEKFPHKISFHFKYFEEIYAVADFIFQYVHLRTYGATFPEHFYGLKRIPDPRQLSVPEKRLFFCLFLSIGVPYLHLQLENLFKKLKEKEADGALQWNEGFSAKIGVVYVRSYPSCHFLWEMIGLCYYMAYAVNKVQYHSPLLHICGMQLVTSAEEDLPSNLWEELAKKNYSLSVAWTLIKNCVSCASTSISIGAFFLQFLEWWYNKEGTKASFSSLPIPPPPAKRPLCVSSHLCPLCRKLRENATALACSGFVFCYSCIFQFVKSNKKCPVTGYPATLTHLVRIYHMGQ